MERFELSAIIPATPEDIYDDWLSSEGHSDMTGGEAVCDAKVGSTFSAWDGYITGENLELERPSRIVQRWWTSEFPRGTDSRVEIRLDAEGQGTRVTIHHWDIPDAVSGRYEEGWKDHYLNPMTRYYSRRRRDGGE